jgi:hypothetical protein
MIVGLVCYHEFRDLWRPAPIFSEFGILALLKQEVMESGFEEFEQDYDVHDVINRTFRHFVR